MAAAALKDAAGGSKNVARTSLRISASKAALVRNAVRGPEEARQGRTTSEAGLFVHCRDISSPALDVGTFFIELRSIHCAWAGNATSRPKASERCLAGARL